MSRLSFGRLFVMAAGLWVAGCGDNYVYSTVVGELGLLSKAVPIDQALTDPNLTDEQRSKIDFVIRARDFAGSTVGLRSDRNYQTFVNLDNQPLAWNLSASQEDAFQAYIWTVPVAGRLPYLGFFNLDEAIAERDRLVADGYDTMLYEVDAFSTLGLLPDPVTSALLRRDWTSLADTVCHELTHTTIFSPYDTNYDESMATFVGRTAAQEFLAAEFGPDSAEVENARLSYEDQDRHQSFIQSLIADLQAVYATDLSREEKLAQRAAVIAAAQQRYASDVLPLMHQKNLYQVFTTLPYNNAYLLGNVRYNKGQDLFAAAYAGTGHDWYQTLTIFAAAANSPSPFDYLQSAVDSMQTNP